LPGHSAPSLYSLPMYTAHAAPFCLFCAVVSFYSLDLFSLRLASSYSLTGQNKLKLLIGFCPALGWSFTLPPGKGKWVSLTKGSPVLPGENHTHYLRPFDSLVSLVHSGQATLTLCLDSPSTRYARSGSLGIGFAHYLMIPLRPPPAYGRQAKSASVVIY